MNNIIILASAIIIAIIAGIYRVKCLMKQEEQKNLIQKKGKLNHVQN